MKTGKISALHALSALFLLFAVESWAQETAATPQRSDCRQCVDLSINGVYSGTIVHRQIVLEIGAVAQNRYLHDETQLPDGSLAPGQTPYPLEGRYFDREDGIPYLVEGRPLPDGSVRIIEFEYRLPTGAEWRLRFEGDHAEGFFCQCDVSQEDERSQPRPKIELKRVSKGFDPNFEWDDCRNGRLVDQAYYDLLLDFPIKNGTEVRLSRHIAYRLQTDTRLQVTMPRITRFPDKAIMEQVNRLLEVVFEDRRLWAANCTQADFGLKGGMSDDKTHVVLTRDMLRIRRESSYSCGWPAPAFDTATVTFNMHNGQSKGSLWSGIELGN